MSATASGTATVQGALWGARAADWAAHETRELAKYERALERVAIEPGMRVLDIGCGSGVFLRAAADRGARVTGLDASPALLELARERAPGAELHAGEMEALPFADGVFDLVTGFNVFFFAADMTAAVREAARVARPGGIVVIQVWGDPERCDLMPVLRALGPLRPARAAGPGPALHEPGRLEWVATEAGLTPREAFSAVTPFAYEDEERMARSIMSAGGAVEAIGEAGEGPVREAIVAAARPFRTRDGGYRFDNEWRYLVARA